MQIVLVQHLAKNLAAKNLAQQVLHLLQRRQLLLKAQKQAAKNNNF